ncbi:MAG: asparaginase [Actinomycetota bacterium]
MPPPVPLVRVVRSGFEESVHWGSVAVADADGSLVASAGEPGRVAFARSSMKPLQAAVSLHLAGESPSEREVAIMCASHNGEPVHVEAVEALLSRGGLEADALRCPPALPADPEDARRVPGPAPALHNCSGKHAGMLLACVRRGLEVETYPDPRHPLQAAVLGAVRTAAGADPRAVGVDGCGVPVHALTLTELATIYARLARPDRLGELAATTARATGAMLAEPYLVGGRDRVCTAVMEDVPGVLVKVGAEGLVCAALWEQGLGIAVKAEDGAARAQAPAVLRVLRLLGALGHQAEGALAGFVRPPALGGGRPVGRLEADFDLVPA